MGQSLYATYFVVPDSVWNSLPTKTYQNLLNNETLMISVSALMKMMIFILFSLSLKGILIHHCIGGSSSDRLLLSWSRYLSIRSIPPGFGKALRSKSTLLSALVGRFY